MAVWCSALGDRFMRGERGRGQWAGSAIASSCQRHGQYRGNTALVANCLAISSGASSFRRLCCLRQSRTPNSTAARAALAGQKRVSVDVVGRAGVVRALMPSHAAPSGGRPATGPTIWWVTKTVPKVNVCHCLASLADGRAPRRVDDEPRAFAGWLRSAGVARGEASPL